MKAKFIQKGDAVDICPTADLEAGEIVRLGNLIGITRLPIKAGELGTLSLVSSDIVGNETYFKNLSVIFIVLSPFLL